MSACVCQRCHQPVDCGETYCPRCEGVIECSCSDGKHCGIDELIQEVKKDVFLFRKKDGTYYLKWTPAQ